MKNVLLTPFLTLLVFFGAFAQDNIGINNPTPDVSAILDITSTNKGILIPRLTEVQRLAIGSPATGLLVYQTDNTNGFWYYDGTVWVNLNTNVTSEFHRINGIVKNTSDIANDNFVFGSNNLNNYAGTNDNKRMFFNKSKGAFRVGIASGTEWDDANVGAFSTAIGRNTTASGYASTAMGRLTIASGNYSTTLGRETTASGSDATAMGYETKAFGNYSTATGITTTASGDAATAMGGFTTATANYSTAMGRYTDASGEAATAMGFYSEASGDYSTAMGSETAAPSYGETTIGSYSTIYTPNNPTAFDVNDRLFTIGNGTSNAARSNSLTVLKNGNIGVGIDIPDSSAIMDLTATDKGMLVPRMSEAQRLAIEGPATGLLVYQTDNSDGFWYFDGTVWLNLSQDNSEFESVGGVVQNTTDLTNDDFVFGSPQLDDDANAAHDRRMFFDKSKGAFRAGQVEGNEWDAANIGTSSAALGRNNIASGDYSIATGRLTTASGSHSTAMGQNSIASGNFSTAIGHNTTAPSFAETSIGMQTTIYTPNSSTLFHINDRIFSIGLGPGSLSNAMTVLKNGNVGIGQDVPTAKLDVIGEVNITDNGGSLNLIGADHTYIQWYPDGLAAGRKGYMGWPSAASDNFTIVNQIPNAHILLSPAATGNVGIATTAPTQAKLVVNGGVGNSLGSYGFLNSSASVNTSTGAGSYSIYATDKIATSEINVFSDARIKNIKGISNSTSDLIVLSKIQVTDYTMKDSITKGNGIIKKVIAQQVKEVYPQAVTANLQTVIPNIYQLAEIDKGWVSLATDLVKGDKVRLIFGDNEELVEVKEANANGFKVNLKNTGKVFVYGKEVSDFHTVDYEAIAMLNVSATQELLKRIEKLEVENKELNQFKIETTSKLEYLETLILEIREVASHSNK